ncbi:hypothetical protein [Nonomuraea polychroma]|nr:hypothetical protein [Nonomuraea polychroma]
MKKPAAWATEREPTQQRIHTVIRTPSGNAHSVDLLRLHLENDH